ncbi:MAG: response regulator transcription factor [Beijerinckiaceae bacterium]|nr:response regulator transcription factor [Beijerinckiaceae bacterium]
MASTPRAPFGNNALSRPPLNNRIVLVEDDEDLAHEIGLALAAEALSTVRLRAAEPLIESRLSAAVILLDRCLNGRDSIHVLERMRANGDRTPTIIISSLTSVEERVNGLKAGADDYLIKPFAMVELVARVQAARRRHDMIQETRLAAGAFEIDRVSRTVYRNGVIIELLPREYELLEFFMLNAGVVLTRSMLLEKVWKINSVTQTNVVDVHIGNLRKKIETENGRVITNIRGQGFRFEREQDGRGDEMRVAN